LTYVPFGQSVAAAGAAAAVVVVVGRAVVVVVGAAVVEVVVEETDEDVVDGAAVVDVVVVGARLAGLVSAPAPLLQPTRARSRTATAASRRVLTGHSIGVHDAEVRQSGEVRQAGRRRAPRDDPGRGPTTWG
jgi:hypothetical protein